MKYYWILALLKPQLKNTENKSPSVLFISTTVSSLYSTKLSAPSATKKRLFLTSILLGCCTLPREAWCLPCAMTALLDDYGAEISSSLPHVCLLEVIFCNACKEWIFFSFKVEIFRKAAQCHRRIKFLQPFIWAFPDLPFKFCEKQEFGNLSKTGSVTLRSISNNDPFRIHEFQLKATLDIPRNHVFTRAGASVETEFHTFLSNLCMQKPMGIQSVREECQDRAGSELWEFPILGKFTIK